MTVAQPRASPAQPFHANLAVHSLDWQDIMDNFANFPTTPISPARGGELIAPSDTSDLMQVSRALYVGQGGDVALTLVDGDNLTFEAVPGGSLLPIRVRAVAATGTSATGLIALW